MLTLEDLKAAITEAAASGSPLYISGSGTKSHIGYAVPGGQATFSVSGYRGMIDYHPEELVLRVKAGTPVSEITSELSRNGQMLAFDPPDHEGSATIGGVISSGLSGSRRPFAGSARDFVLGAGLVLADGSYREFGGQVMKNVAGYDVSRLVCGAWGTLGIIADVSLKVLPRPEREASRSLPLDLDHARQQVTELRAAVNGLSASCYRDGALMLRISGTAEAVDQALSRIGGEPMDDSCWQAIDRQEYPGMDAGELWRLSTDPAEPVEHDFAWMDWNFGQRWLVNPAGNPRENYRGAGHWTRFSATGDGAPFSQPVGLMQLHRALKQAFDPAGLFNPGRMYEGV